MSCFNILKQENLGVFWVKSTFHLEFFFKFTLTKGSKKKIRSKKVKLKRNHSKLLKWKSNWLELKVFWFSVCSFCEFYWFRFKRGFFFVGMFCFWYLKKVSRNEKSFPHSCLIMVIGALTLSASCVSGPVLFQAFTLILWLNFNLYFTYLMLHLILNGAWIYFSPPVIYCFRTLMSILRILHTHIGQGWNRDKTSQGWAGWARLTLMEIPGRG